MKAPLLNFLRHIVSNGTQESGNFFRPHSVAPQDFTVSAVSRCPEIRNKRSKFPKRKRSCIILGAITVNNDLTRIRD